jgi:hypothetical protein
MKERSKMSEQESEIRRLLGPTYDDAKQIAQQVADRKTHESDAEAALIGVLILRLSNAEARAEYLAERHSFYLNEAQRLAKLVYDLGGNPSP